MDDRVSERIARLEANDSNIFHQLDEIKAEVKDIHKLTTAVEKIAVQTENTAKKVDAISSRLDSVERTPAEDLRHYRRVIATAVLTGIIGAVLGAFFALIIR